MLFKTASVALTPDNTRVIEARQALSTDNTTKQFARLIKAVRRIAPKSAEFTYFVCRAIHAMEAANIDPRTGQIVGDGHIGEDGKWHSAGGIIPYINQNGDGFPEGELLAVVSTRSDGTEVRAFETFIGT